MPLDPADARWLSAALTRICTRSPFFGALVMSARIQTSAQVPTAATNGRDIFINPEFFAPLSSNEREAVLLHEVLHAALLHVSRRAERDPHQWNIAADIVVNGMVAEQGYSLPGGAIREPNLERLAVEEVYDLLGRQGKAPALPWADLLSEAPGDSEGTGSDANAGMSAERYWRNALERARAVASSTAHGLQPGAWQRELEQLSAAQLDWRTYLWRFLTHTPTDFSGFDRRFIGQRLYLDTLEGESLRLAVCVDTSGSIDSEMLRLFLSEVAGILQTYPHLTCDLYYADAGLHGPYPLAAGQTVPPPTGGGGTNFAPFFDHLAAETRGWSPLVAVYLTDGYGDFPRTAPQFPVLWVIAPGGLSPADFPFGETTTLLLFG